MTWRLPPGWGWQRVDEAVTPTRSQVKPEEIPDDWLYLGLEHVHATTGEFRAVKAGGAAIKSTKFQFDDGDILYGRLRPNLRKCLVAAHPGICSTDLLPLRPVRPEAAYFIALQMRSELFTREVMRHIGGANLPRVNVADLLALSLPVPPPEKEERLFAAAASVLTLRSHLRAAQAAIDDVDLATTAHALGQGPGQLRP